MVQGGLKKGLEGPEMTQKKEKLVFFIKRSIFLPLNMSGGVSALLGVWGLFWEGALGHHQEVSKTALMAKNTKKPKNSIFR